jgi:hypothetical protein
MKPLCKLSKLFLPITCNLALIIGISTAHAQELEGDQKDACEALLCLSSSQRPTECEPPIRRYLSIHRKTPGKTANARRDFLKQCPTAQSDGKTQALVNAIVSGAGYCDAASLNNNRTIMQVTRCDGQIVTPGQPMTRTLPNGLTIRQTLSPDSCTTEHVFVINPNKPGYCTAYEPNEYTDLTGVVYVGEPLNGGHWEDGQ